MGENAEVIRDLFAATNERDWPRVISHYADDVVLVVPPSYSLLTGTFEGRESLRAWFSDWFRSFEADAAFEITEVSEVDERHVLLCADHRARGRLSGVEIERTVIWLYNLEGGLIVHCQAFDSREEALAATGR